MMYLAMLLVSFGMIFFSKGYQSMACGLVCSTLLWAMVKSTEMTRKDKE